LCEDAFSDRDQVSSELHQKLEEITILKHELGTCLTKMTLLEAELVDARQKLAKTNFLENENLRLSKELFEWQNFHMCPKETKVGAINDPSWITIENELAQAQERLRRLDELEANECKLHEITLENEKLKRQLAAEQESVSHQHKLAEQKIAALQTKYKTVSSLNATLEVSIVIRSNSNRFESQFYRSGKIREELGFLNLDSKIYHDCRRKL
jgi:hypothetical protein